MLVGVPSNLRGRVVLSVGTSRRDPCFSASVGERIEYRLADGFEVGKRLEGTALWVVSGPGTFDYISAGFEDIWGIPADAVENDVSRLIESVHPDDRDRVRSEIETSEPEISRKSYESRVVRPDGTVRWVKVGQFPLRDSEGDLTELVGICTDVTDIKRRERELEALNRIVRHDIRNDMSIILGWSELLGEHVDEAGEDILQKILTSGEHIVELTEISRDYAETITGDEVMAMKPVALRSTLQNEITLRRESFPDAEVTIIGEIPDVDVTANEMLSSVFRNLLNNAVQHNDTDTPIVEVDCERRDEDVVVRIADNGPGVPDERKESIFEKGETGVESSGTGIGLYVVQTLVKQYEGDVRITDNSPTGTVVTVRLPRPD